MRSLLLTFTILSASSGTAQASCTPRTACFEVTGSIASCEVVEQDGASFVRLVVPAPTVVASTCGIEQHDYSSRDTDQMLNWLKTQTIFVAAKSYGISCDSLGRSLRAVDTELCCDTEPPEGACAVRGVFVELRTPNPSR